MNEDTLENDLVNNGQDSAVVLQGEVRDAISSMLSSHKE